MWCPLRLQAFPTQRTCCHTFLSWSIKSKHMHVQTMLNQTGTQWMAKIYIWSKFLGQSRIYPENKGYFSAIWELLKLGQGWQEQDLGPQMASRVFLITHLKCIWLDCAHYMQYISIFYSILLAQWEIWAGMKSSCLLGKPRARLNLRIMLNSLHIGSGSKLW